MKKVYYNENDPFAAAWLRGLCAVGAIPDGDVDERDVRDVCPADLDGYVQCHFFAGIGVWAYALALAGWPADRPVWTGSCPCQSFSAAGKRAGFDDERHLWPYWHHLIRVRRPPVVFGEQVASKDGLAWLDLVQADMEGEGYAIGAADLCAAGVGAPHIRQRLWFVGVGEADSDNTGLEGWRKSECKRAVERASGPRGLADILDLSTSRGVFHAPGDGRIERGSEPSGRGVAGGCGHDGMADRDADGRGRLSTAWLHGRRSGEGSLAPAQGGADRTLGDDPDRCAASVSMADTCGGLLQEPLGESQARNGARPVGADDTGCPGRPGPANGFWRDPDWLLCRDGKWRPVEGGTFPLAHGDPARVGRLRGYGNAINPYQAKEVIASFLDIVSTPGEAAHGVS